MVLYSIALYSQNADEQYNIARGSEPELMSYYNDAKNYRYMVFLNFDIQNLPASNLIESVKLKLYGVAEAGGGINTATSNPTPTAHNLAVYNISSYNKIWEESTFTYNDWVYKYGYNRTPGEHIAQLSDVSGEGWLEWDITNDVKAMKDANASSYTLSICDTYVVKSTTGTNTNAYVRFHSRENSSGNKPSLVVITKAGASINHTSKEKTDYILNGKTLSLPNIEGNTRVYISDISGRLVHNALINAEYDYTFSASGIYILHLTNENSSVATKIVVK